MRGLLCLELREFAFDRSAQRLLLSASRSGSELTFKRRDLVVERATLLRVHQRLQLFAKRRNLWRIEVRVPRIVDLTLVVPRVLPIPNEIIDARAKCRLPSAIVRIKFRITRADRVCSLEHHVLKEVTDSSDARTLVDRANLRNPTSRNDVGLIMSRHEKKLHPVLEHKDLRLDFLRRCARSKRGGNEARSKRKERAIKLSHSRTPKRGTIKIRIGKAYTEVKVRGCGVTSRHS